VLALLLAGTPASASASCGRWIVDARRAAVDARARVDWGRWVLVPDRAARRAGLQLHEEVPEGVPLLARLLRDDGRQIFARTIVGELATLPRNRVRSLDAVDGMAAFDAVIAHFRKLGGVPNPTPGHTYTFRDASWGTIRNGTLIEIRDGIAVLDSGGARHHVPAGELGRTPGPRAAYNLLQHGNLPDLHARLWPPRLGPRMRQTLDAARRVTSSDAFARLDAERKVRVVANFVNLFFSRDHRFAYPFSGYPTEDVLYSGCGVCVHKEFLTKNIFSEAGYEAHGNRADGRTGPFGPKCGHAWASAVVDGTLFYVDAGKDYPAVGRRDFLTREEAERLAELDGFSLAAQFYLRGTRRRR
jgi:hypothetical protein